MTTFAKINNSGVPPIDQVLIWRNLIYQQFNTLAVQGNLSPENNLILRVVPLAHNRPLMWKIGCLAKQLHTHSLLTFVNLKPTACEIKSICQKGYIFTIWCKYKNAMYWCFPRCWRCIPLDLLFFCMICYFQVGALAKVHPEVGSGLEVVLTCKVCHNLIPPATG